MQADFEEFLFNFHFKDAGYIGNKFTWCNNRAKGARILERLDRFIINDDLSTLFPSFHVLHGTRIASDHCPLIARLGDCDGFLRCNLPRFEDMWLQVPRSYFILKAIWRKKFSENAIVDYNKKIETSMKKLKAWGRGMFSNLRKRAAFLENKLANLQCEDALANINIRKNSSMVQLAEISEICNFIDHFPGSSYGGTAVQHADFASQNQKIDNLSKEMADTMKELNMVLGRLKAWWVQRAKSKWIREGDTNTRYFHSMASANKRQAYIWKVTNEDGDQLDKYDDIVASFLNFFNKKWCDSVKIIEKDWPSVPYCLSDIEAESLEMEVTDIEIVNALKELGENKASGIDGITSCFFYGYWDIVGPGTVAAIKEFFASSFMPQEWKDNLITLIPKKPDANQPKDYRPISLCSSTYKIIAKVLVNRMKRFIPSLVSPSQAAFVPGRCISDHCFAA